MRLLFNVSMAIAVVCFVVGCSTTDPVNDQVVRVRKNVTALSTQEKADFVAALRS
ncbi:MAG: hypothetical protein IPH85_04435 [Ignavibacteria bacterium]|nr:hypothetical protein [Ignavibacteria bacterium]